MTKKEQRTKKIKDVLKKVLNVFCYVVTGLTIVLGVAMGVNSCAGGGRDPKEEQRSSLVQSPKNAQGEFTAVEDYFVYVSKYDGNLSVDFDDVRSFFNVPGVSYGTSQSIVYHSLFFTDMYMFVNSETYAVKQMIFTFRTYPLTGNTPPYMYRLSNVGFRSVDNSDFWFYGKTGNTYDDNMGTFRADFKIVMTSDVISNYAFSSFFQLGEKTKFVFNKVFNYNAPYFYTLSAPYIPSINATTSRYAVKTYDVGWFFTNGQLFDTIEVWYLVSTGEVAYIDDKGIRQTAPNGGGVYNYMYFRNSVTSAEVMVNWRDAIGYTDGNASSVAYLSTSTWRVDSFRSILFLQPLSDENKMNIEQFNNNNQVYTSGYLVSGEVNDVFSLVASAFTGLLPILGVYLLPNITIGTLLFVPLVAMLVFAIIRIIKK